MARGAKGDLTQAALMARRSWQPLPGVAALHGDADFLKREAAERFTRELFGDSEPSVRRFSGEKEASTPTLADVLDELLTPSFLAPERLVVFQAADRFLAAHREALLPYLEKGFGGGHLLLLLENLDGRTRFAQALAEKGWAVACKQPYDSPPPWKPDAAPWDNDLCRWVVSRARGKGLAFDPELAHAFQARVGTDLATLDDELEKLRSYLGPKGRPDLASIEAVAGELREDSIFDLADAFLAGKRGEALKIAERLLDLGYHQQKGSVVTDPGTIWSLFVGALIPRLRALRRAHVLAAGGGGPEVWVSEGLTRRPFLPRFEREFRSTPRPRIERAFCELLTLDRAVKTGGDARLSLESFVLRV